MLYDVALCPELLVRIRQVEADTPEQAIDKAIDFMQTSGVWDILKRKVNMASDESDDTFVEYVELSDNMESALVDVVGDVDFSRSQWFQLKDGWKPYG